MGVWRWIHGSAAFLIHHLEFLFLDSCKIHQILAELLAAGACFPTGRLAEQIRQRRILIFADTID
jgi:hypothetical protein